MTCVLILLSEKNFLFVDKIGRRLRLHNSQSDFSIFPTSAKEKVQEKIKDVVIYIFHMMTRQVLSCSSVAITFPGNHYTWIDLTNSYKPCSVKY